MTALRAVIFDWAGTMIDFGSCAPVDALQAAFRAFGVSATEESLRAGMGRAKREHVEIALASGDVFARWRAVHGSAPSDTDIDAIMRQLELALPDAARRHAMLIDGAASVVGALRARGVRIGSTTGYTRTMMSEILESAARQGYTPDCVVCAGETPRGRPAPFLIWQAMTRLDVWPARACVVVDDAPVGVMAGRNAGGWTVGVAASGNEVGLTEEAYATLAAASRTAALERAVTAHRAAGADYVIATVADLPAVIDDLEPRIAAAETPGREPTRAMLPG